MQDIGYLLWEIAAAVAFGFLLQKLRVPGGMLIGAIIGTAILSIGFSIGTAPSWFKLVAQILTGSYLGCTISRDEVKQIPRVLGRP